MTDHDLDQHLAQQEQAYNEMIEVDQYLKENEMNKISTIDISIHSNYHYLVFVHRGESCKLYLLRPNSASQRRLQKVLAPLAVSAFNFPYTDYGIHQVRYKF